jgi:tetratricopeptide (TPR) repeat protein
VQQARETGDPSYYGKAQSVFDEAQKRDRQHIEMLVGQGSLALARHDFRAALALGEQARTLNPDVPRIYGVIGDAQIELGMYDEAVATIQAMVDMRPDLSSYTRVAYLRELHGDLPGAIEIMQSALSAGGPTAENTEWTRVQLGNLYFNAGNLEAAEQQYQRALSLLPDYVPAIVALAHIHAAEGRLDDAVRLLADATQRMPLPEYVIALGDVYTRQGKREQAQEQYELVAVIDKLFASNGVNTDLEIALFMADHDLDLPASLQKARAAYAARPSIHAADVLAWTLYKTGEYNEAQRYAEEALKLGTHDGLKLFHAAMIARALGQNEIARTYLQRAIDHNPHFSLLYSDQAAETLRQLGGTPPQRSK